MQGRLHTQRSERSSLGAAKYLLRGESNLLAASNFAQRLARSRSIGMPPTIVKPAVPVERVVDPACVWDIRRPPKGRPEDCADHSTNDSAWRPCYHKAGSSTECRTNHIRTRTRRSCEHQKNSGARIQNPAHDSFSVCNRSHQWPTTLAPAMTLRCSFGIAKLR